jgi:coronin-1B/1C/6
MILTQCSIFPPANSIEPALTSSEWLSGKTANPKLVDLETQAITTSSTPISAPPKPHHAPEKSQSAPPSYQAPKEVKNEPKLAAVTEPEPEPEAGGMEIEQKDEESEEEAVPEPKKEVIQEKQKEVIQGKQKEVEVPKTVSAVEQKSSGGAPSPGNAGPVVAVSPRP